MASTGPIVWDKTGERLYETGVDRGVLYPMVGAAYPKGIAWNGLTSVTNSPSGAEASPLYADNIKYLNLMSAEEFGATIEAYYSPKEFDACDGSAELVQGVSVGQQKRQMFGLSYRTKIGNDTEGEEHGYKIHLIYGCLASPTQRTYNSINDSPEANTLSWEVSTTPVSVAGMKPTSYICIDSTKVNAEKLVAFEKVLYGDSAADARLPLPDEVKELLTPTLAV